MKNIEKFYPLSPMQQGILFHTLYAPKSGVYVEQLSCDIQGDLNIVLFQQAWQKLVEKHSILRTSFIWEGIKEPVQVVHKQVELPWQQQDLSKLELIEQQEHIEADLVAEREKGFEISQAPLMRLKLLQLAEKHYKFIWTHHHLLLDGWSSSLLLQELFTCYQVLNQGEGIQLQNPRPYRDYIAWLQKQNLSSAEIFWKKYLKDFTTVTSVGVEQNLSNQISENKNYITQILRLSITKTTSLQSLARQQQLTLNTILQGAWAILLSRYSGENDIVFGGVVSGRPTNLAGVESMVGVFINTLPVRVSINPKESLIPWLKQLQIQQNEVRQYEYTPLIEIQKWSEIPTGQPLFESILNFQNYPINSSLQTPIDNVKIFNINSFIHPHYPLNVSVQVDSKLSLEIFYNSLHFDDDKIARMLGHLQTLILSMVDNHQQCLGELPLLTATERYQLLEEWNNTRVDYPQNQCIHQLFEAQVEKTPDAVAVVFENQQLTYRELNAKANQIAHYLQKLGVGKEVLVGICIERSLEMVIGLLGIFKAGGAYVPLDPTYPQERLAFMLENSQVTVLLTQKHLLESLPAHQAKTIYLDSNWEVIAQETTENPVHSITPENLAYVIYTSGSTGKPKGAMNTHQAICNRLLWMQDYCQLTTADRVLQKTPFSFDVSVWEFFLPLLVGARLIVAQPQGHRDTNYLVNVITQQQITTVHFVPSMLQVFLEQPGIEKCKCIKRVICSGEALPIELEKRFFQRLDAELHNLYGPTEAAIDVTFWKCEHYSSSATVPIGRPIANTQIYLLDRDLNPVPIGVPGELYIGGVGLAKGYLNNPELTTEKFIPHPFNNKPGARLYKTGDLARYLPDGNIEFLRRIDYQVKIRGFRIELGEIEAVLNQHPAVRETVVTAQLDELRHQRLIAYVVANHPFLHINQLRSFLQEKLPEYMLPSAFVMLKAMPLTPNGKLDRRALPAPDQQRPQLQSAFLAPQTPIEKQLAEIWMQVLGLKQVGVNDNFFELGGDSILSLQVIAKANQVGLHFTPKQMFQHQTIAQLATVANVKSNNSSQQGIITGKVSLTPIQYWFFEQNLPEPHHWNQSVLLEVQEPLDPALVKQALKSLLIHHDALRLLFREEDMGWQAAIAPPNDEISLTWLDLSVLSSQQQETMLVDTANKLQSSLNLADGPLLQVAYFDFGINKPGRLLWVIHHLAVDGVSWRILIEDFQTAYQLLNKGETIQLPAKTTSFKHWSEQLQNYAQLPNVQSQLDYWCNSVDQSVKPIAVDFPQGNNTEASVRSISVNLSVEETQALLQDVPNIYRTQINNVLLAALGHTFKQWTDQSSLLVDLEGHGREEIFDDIDLSRTLGWFTTIFPVLLEVGNANNLGDTLQNVKEQMRLLPNRGFDYGVLRYLSNQTDIIEKLQAQPQPEVIFNYLGQFDQMLPQLSLFKLAKESTGATHSPRGNRRYLLEVEGMVINAQLQLQWSYSSNLHRQGTVETLALVMVEALRSLIIDCQTAEVNNYTPEDFPDADISQDQLDQVFAELALD
ncbi:MAG: amino acid adenylation domain-containing protein [Nostoc indistinguendum CM1-VF10]|jgi:amino acid adenylation domain-containing protein/non-ribosomal peptide synthase protein (TIGR01720 family)|nr:amino acid adenylation domain-containing protein [Nostoc indistinguendum CM1-VF10]